jgi:hypothetical protein
MQNYIYELLRIRFVVLTTREYGDNLDLGAYKILCLFSLREVEDMLRRRFANTEESIQGLDRDFHAVARDFSTDELRAQLAEFVDTISSLNRERRRILQTQTRERWALDFFHLQAALTKVKNKQCIAQWFLKRRAVRGMADPPPVVEQAQAAVADMQAEVAALQEAEHAEPAVDLQHDLQNLAAAFESLEASHPGESHGELVRELDEFQKHIEQAQLQDDERRQLLAAIQHGLDETNGLLDDLINDRAVQVQRQGPGLYKAWLAATRAECSPPA